MQISNDDLARILGRMEGKLDAQAPAIKRVEDGLASLEVKVTTRLDNHDERLRELEVANPKELAKKVKDHDERIRTLEKGAAKAGMVAGVGSSVVIAVIVEAFKRKLGM
jgi:hypothetical protein